MLPHLLEELPSHRFTFVVGKGGVGKSTTAASIALHWADAGADIHLISTDPAPSIRDIFGIEEARGQPSPCNARLLLEELDAQHTTDEWIARVRASLEQLIEQGTYLDADDISRLTHLTLPGVDELGAALRLAELARGNARIVVDTAPTGHTLRLLDTAALIESWAAVFNAMANKVATIAFTMVNARVRLPGEDTIDDMRRTADSFRNAMRDAQFVVVTRNGTVIEAETSRLIDALRARNLRVNAVVRMSDGVELAHHTVIDSYDVISVPHLPDVRGCEGLRAWAASARIDRNATADVVPSNSGAPLSAMDSPSGDARAWLEARTQRLLWFAGKGGTGKSTCAAAAACVLSDSRPVLLCSTDPAGSLREVLGTKAQPDGTTIAPRLRALQVDAAAQLSEWRDKYREEAERVFSELGVGGTATLDREIMNAIWDAVPPGIDELFALSEIIDAADGSETIVVDAAPTGHFLRLIESPEMALDWTHAILRILLKYGVAGRLEGFSERVLAFARQLKQLRSMLTDSAVCGVCVVTLEEPVVAAQTERLVRTLENMHIDVACVIANRVVSPAEHVVTTRAGGHTMIQAPQMATSPAGLDALVSFASGWHLA